MVGKLKWWKGKPKHQHKERNTDKQTTQTNINKITKQNI